MKSTKITHYKISISPRFFAGHPRAGQPTRFKKIILNSLTNHEIVNALNSGLINPLDVIKIHTIRQNYPLWVKRMEKVHAGKAVIDLCEWKLPGGRFTPGNELIPFVTLDKDSGCGVQELVLNPKCILSDSVELFSIDSNFYNPLKLGLLSKNDGLSLDDFKAWFKGYDLSKPMVIIHFGSFRY